MRQLIDKFLQEKTTQDEEHLLAQLLQQQQKEEDMEQWLTEDETATYDLIVGQRKARQQHFRWMAAAASIILVLAAGTIILWPRQEQSVAQDLRTTERPATPIEKTFEAPASPVAPTSQVPVVAHQTGSRRSQKKAVANTADTADSLQYYITRLEQELAQVKDSTYTAKAEQIIHADARLQRLVQRIMIGEITRTDESVEAVNHIHETEEEQP